MFGYATVAGLAGNAPPALPNGSTLALPAAPTTDWYIVAADADLDGNATEPNNTHVYGTSLSNQIFVDHEGQ